MASNSFNLEAALKLWNVVHACLLSRQPRVWWTHEPGSIVSEIIEYVALAATHTEQWVVGPNRMFHSRSSSSVILVFAAMFSKFETDAITDQDHPFLRETNQPSCSPETTAINFMKPSASLSVNSPPSQPSLHCRIFSTPRLNPFSAVQGPRLLWWCRKARRSLFGYMLWPCPETSHSCSSVDL